MRNHCVLSQDRLESFLFFLADGFLKFRRIPSNWRPLLAYKMLSQKQAEEQISSLHLFKTFLQEESHYQQVEEKVAIHLSKMKECPERANLYKEFMDKVTMNDVQNGWRGHGSFKFVSFLALRIIGNNLFPSGFILLISQDVEKQAEGLQILKDQKSSFCKALMKQIPQDEMSKIEESVAALRAEKTKAAHLKDLEKALEKDRRAK